MYRKPGSSGVLQGVLSGPYTGGPRRVLASKLPRAARQRLADVLAGRTEPMPIAHERPAGFVSQAHATWAMLVGVIALSAIIAAGFGDPRAEWALQPLSVVPLYMAIVIMSGLALLAVLRRHARASGMSIMPGRYLLPLDVVEVPVEDASGEQVIVVTPLGDARDARVRREELVLAMAGGDEVRFALRSERDGEAALRRLEHAQRLLEDLSYSHDLERALSQDAFFDVRADNSWTSVAPDGPASKRTTGRLLGTRARRAWLHRPAASALAVVASAGLGLLAFHGRNFMSDRALYLRALRAGTPEQLDAYLERGRAYQSEAVALRERLREQREELAKRATEARKQASDSTPKAEWELTAEELAVRRGTAEACAVSLRTRASAAYPSVPRIVRTLLDRATRTGDPKVPVRLSVKASRFEGPDPSGDGPMAGRTEEGSRAKATIRAFERTFSEVCPASILEFVMAPDALPAENAPGLDIRVELTWPRAPTWKVTPSPKRYACGPRDVAVVDRAPTVQCPPDGKLAVFAPSYAFDVTLRGVGQGPDDRATFHLTMPPPLAPSMALRDRSVFLLAGDAPPAGTFDERVYDVLSARAFDRLYDELWGLFFAGDPRVPLREPPDAPP